MANICRGLRKNFFSPVLKSPTHIGFIGVKKMGQKSHTWAPLSDPGKKQLGMQKFTLGKKNTVQDVNMLMSYLAFEKKGSGF